MTNLTIFKAYFWKFEIIALYLNMTYINSKELIKFKIYKIIFKSSNSAIKIDILINFYYY